MSASKRCLAVLILIGIVGIRFGSADAAAREDVEINSYGRSEKLQAVDGKRDFQKWVLFPVIGSTSETGLIIGGLAVRFFEASIPDIRTNTIDFLAFGTMEEQYQVIVAPNFYLKDELYHINLSLVGSVWPANYYGIGNDTSEDDREEYDSSAVAGEVLFERRVRHGVYIGVHFALKTEEVDAYPDGMLQRDQITGFDGGLQSGFGVDITWDTRDNLNDTRKGNFLKFGSDWFRPALGSEFDFKKYEFYLCHFLPLTENTTLALGGRIDLARGEIPFRELNSPDGNSLLRGIEFGRYRDRDMAGLQAEYRFLISGRWGAVLFAETAQVAHAVDHLTMDGWKYSLGGGLRYALNPDERFNLRLDLSLVDGGMGFTLNFREAF